MNGLNWKYILAMFLLAGGLLVFVFTHYRNSNPNPPALTQSVPPASTSSQSSPASSSPAALTPVPPSGFAFPISNALSRIIKKPFGLYVSPGHSPVEPEKFTGYHTGVDFETTPDEQNTDVPIFALCDGPLKVSRYASGYGGVAVQACIINQQAVTVIYGHLRLSSVYPKVNDQLRAGQQLAVLGTGYSSETDGERKHLHLGIHKGTAINILGYVQKQSDLAGWLDASVLLK